MINKCSFCPDSKLKNGVLVCPWNICMMSQKDINKILKNLGGIKF